MAYEKPPRCGPGACGDIEGLEFLGYKFTAVHAAIVARQIAVFAPFQFLVWMHTGRYLTRPGYTSLRPLHRKASASVRSLRLPSAFHSSGRHLEVSTCPRVPIPAG